MRVSLAASLLMLSGKSIAYFMTHSTAILSDALESLVHGFATGFAALSLWYAAQPADENHPYGHGRIAYFSAGFEGSLVMMASFSIMYSGISAFVTGVELDYIGYGLAITGVLALLNLFLGFSLIHVGKKHDELILVANGRHVLSDMWTSVAAITGLLLVLATGWSWLDPLTALVIGGYIMSEGFRLIRESYRGLMDEMDPAMARQINDILQAAVAEGRITSFHQLRCRQIHKDIWIEVHVLLPGDMRTDDAHDRVLTVERRLMDAFSEKRVHVLTHVEPENHEQAHPHGIGHAANDPLASIGE